jgi:thiol:disulfide interchange protein
MKESFKPVVGIFVIVAAVWAVVGISRFFGGKDRVPWRHDFSSGRAEALNSGKPMLLYLTASWCEPCQKLKTTTWADDEVNAALSKYVPVKVDVDESADIAGEYGAADGLPCFVLFNAAGEPTQVHNGYLGPGDFVQWMRERPVTVITTTRSSIGE